MPHTSQWYFREWVNEWSLEHSQLLHGGVITAAGCRPVVGTVDPLPGMRGPVWDIYVEITPALAGGVPRTIYVHPSSDGKLTRIATGTDAERAESLAAVRGGVRAKLLALYPGMPPRVHPRGPQEQIGSEQVAGLLLGGRRASHAQTGVVQGFGLPTVGSQAALAAGAASSSVGPAAPTQASPIPPPGAYVGGVAGTGTVCLAHVVQTGGVALAATTTDPSQLSAAAVQQAQDMRRRDYLVVVDSNRNEAMWCGWNLFLYENGIWAHWHGSWWRLRGPDPVFHPYSTEHWWEPEDAAIP